MIHYHGTPVGGPRAGTARFLQGRHAMVSSYRPDDLEAAKEFCQSFCLDCGAYSHWKSGKGDVDFHGYRAWVSSMWGHPALDWAIIPDKIDGTEAQNRELIAEWQKYGCPVEGVPVWHLHESLEWLSHLVANFRTVALGSSGQWATPGTSAWWARMGEAMKAACDNNGRPRARLHGLRMLNPDIFTRLPLASADSTNAAVNSGSVTRFGMYCPSTQWQRAEIIAARIEMHNSAACWVPGAVQEDLLA